MNKLPAENRKGLPIARGVLDFFPNAIAEVSTVSAMGAHQHYDNPRQELEFGSVDRGNDADALLRHLIDRGDIDSDGVRHSAKVAWRALALLQVEIEEEEEHSG